MLFELDSMKFIIIMREVENMLKIRNETEADYQIVEEIIRKAFYNVYRPGCTEHYLAHVMRGHEDFIPELEDRKSVV